MTSWKELPERERSIIEHVARYRVSTDEVLHELFFATAKSLKTVQKSLARLVDAGWLEKFQSVQRRNLYTLGNNFERPRSWRRPAANFSEQSLPTAIAILYFCVRQHHRRLTVPELQSLDPRLCPTGLRNSPYYVEKRGNRLGLSLFLVDRNSPVRRLTWKVKRLVGQRTKHDAFRAWMMDQRFSITVLTPFAEKQRQLTEAFADRAKEIVPVRVALVPEFGPYVSDV